VTFGDQHVGTIGDLGCMSFYADKTITSGEGGAVYTNNDKLADRCRYFKNQGRLNRGSFIHPQFGVNFRVTDLQSAIGVEQMKKLDWIIERKNENENLYKKLLHGVKEVQFPADTKVGRRVPFRINILAQDPDGLSEFLTGNEIGVRRFFYPLHRQPCFNNKNSRRLKTYKHVDKIFRRGISLPSGVGLTTEQIQYVCAKIKEYYA
jgi:perosamine synthetase